MLYAGQNPAEDRFRCGYIAAVNDFLSMELIEEESSEQDENY
jgi:hypothetical protein